MSNWKDYVSAALTNLRAALATTGEDAQGHLADAAHSVGRAIDALEEAGEASEDGAEGDGE